MFVSSFQSKLKACQGSIELEDIKFKKANSKVLTPFSISFLRGRDSFGRQLEIQPRFQAYSLRDKSLREKDWVLGCKKSRTLGNIGS